MTTGWHWALRTTAVSIIATWLIVGLSGPSAADDTTPAPAPAPPNSEESVESRGINPFKSPSQIQANPKLHQVTPGLRVTPVCGISVPNEIGSKPHVQPTHYLTLPPTAFTMSSYQYTELFRIGAREIYAWRRDYNTKAAFPYITFEAPVFLPHGIVIRQLEALFLDDDPAADLELTLHETLPSAAGSFPPGDARPHLTDRSLSIVSGCIPSGSRGTSKPSGYGAYDIMQLTGVALPVNSQHAYSVRLAWTVNWHTPAITGESIMVRLVRIGYTLE